MKLTIECERCGAKVEVSPKAGVTYVDLRRSLQDGGMDISFDVDDIDDIEDASEVNIKAFEFSCLRCNEYTTFDL